MSDADARRSTSCYHGLDFARSLAIPGMVLVKEARITLLKRAAFLLLLGTGLITKWRPDILHYYAPYLTAALFFSVVRRRGCSWERPFQGHGHRLTGRDALR